MTPYSNHLEKIAESAWRRLQLRPPCDLRAVCEFLGITVILDTPPCGTRGAWVASECGGVIYVSPALSFRTMRLVWAHEVAHAIWARAAPGQVVCGAATYSHHSLLERQCDEFAHYLLVPTSHLASRALELGHDDRHNRTALLAAEFGVPYNLMRRRLRGLGRRRFWSRSDAPSGTQRYRANEDRCVYRLGSKAV